MKSPSKAGKDIYSDSDDDMCIVHDENEEMNVFGALSLFLKSPKNKMQSQAHLQKLSQQEQKLLRTETAIAETYIRKASLEAPQREQNRRSIALDLHINQSSIGRVSRTKSSIYKSMTKDDEVDSLDESCMVLSSDEASLSRGNKPRKDTLTDRLNLRSSMTFSGVSRKGTHQEQSQTTQISMHSKSVDSNAAKLRVQSEVVFSAADRINNK